LRMPGLGVLATHPSAPKAQGCVFRSARIAVAMKWAGTSTNNLKKLGMAGGNGRRLRRPRLQRINVATALGLRA
jgi:hypothetical protein